MIPRVQNVAFQFLIVWFLIKRNVIEHKLFCILQIFLFHMYTAATNSSYYTTSRDQHDTEQNGTRYEQHVLALCYLLIQIHPLSVFRLEGSPEERKRFRWDFGSAKDLPVRFHIDSLSRWKTWLHRKDSSEIMYLPVEISGYQNATGSPKKPAEALPLKK